MINSADPSSKLKEFKQQLSRDAFQKLQIEVNIMKRQLQKEEERAAEREQLLASGASEMQRYKELY